MRDVDLRPGIAIGSDLLLGPEALPPETKSVRPSADHAIPRNVDGRSMCCVCFLVFVSKTVSAWDRKPEFTATTTLPSGETVRFVTRSPKVPIALPAGVIRQPFGRSEPPVKCSEASLFRHQAHEIVPEEMYFAKKRPRAPVRGKDIA